MHDFGEHSDVARLFGNSNDISLDSLKRQLDNYTDFNCLPMNDVDISLGNFIYPCRFKYNPDALYLSVQLHGSTPRKDVTLPIFPRWNWGKVLGAHVLSICDPTIYKDNSLEIGWYLGNRNENVTLGIVAIAQHFAKIIGLPDDHIIFSGGSGGGFASLQAAAVAKSGRAIASNPQIDLSQFKSVHVKNYIDKVSGCSSLQDVESVFAQRWNVIRSLQESREKGNNPKIVFVQNRNDLAHYRKHYTPFAKAFCLSLFDDQSVSGNFMSILYDGPEGHKMDPSEVVKRIINEGVPFLLGETVAPIAPDFFTKITADADKIQAEIQTSADGYEFACYLYKDGVAIEKQFYSSNNRFTFNPRGLGEYFCRGFLRNKFNDTFASSSDIINFPPSMVKIS